MANDKIQIHDLALTPEETVETLRAIRAGDVDAVVVESPHGAKVLTFHDPAHAYRVLVESLGEGAALVSPQGVVCYHNPRFAALFGSPCKPMLGQTLRTLVTADAAVSLETLLERAAEGVASVELELALA